MRKGGGLHTFLLLDEKLFSNCLEECNINVLLVFLCYAVLENLLCCVTFLYRHLFRYSSAIIDVGNRCIFADRRRNNAMASKVML